jgi:hypothetical protein
MFPADFADLYSSVGSTGRKLKVVGDGRLII